VYVLLLVLLLVDGLFMTVVVLLQSGKGGGLASMGGGQGSDTLIGGRQAATLLTKATWASGGAFLALALILSVLSSRATQQGSILRNAVPAPAAQTAPPPLDLTGSANSAGTPAGTQAPITPTPAAGTTSSQ
jgi:preprotein translocase subunit SecG